MSNVPKIREGTSLFALAIDAEESPDRLRRLPRWTLPRDIRVRGLNPSTTTNSQWTLPAVQHTSSSERNYFEHGMGTVGIDTVVKFYAAVKVQVAVIASLHHEAGRQRS